MTIFCRFSIHAIRPEGGIVKLKREGISLYHVVKKQKNELYFSVKQKDKEKVFAILQNSCYNVKEEYPEGWAHLFRALKQNAIFLVGCILLIFVPYLLSPFIFRIEIVGEEKYRDYVLSILEEEGLSFGERYRKNTMVTTRLLSLKNVSYASVQKEGYLLKVELHARKGETKVESVPLVAKCDGQIESIVVLSGKANVAVGDEVKSGMELISSDGASFVSGKVSILCHAFGTKEELLLLNDGEYLSLKECENGFEMTYRKIERIYF